MDVRTLATAVRNLPRLKTAHGAVSVVTRKELEQIPAWRQAFAHERKDHRYFEIVEDTILQGFEYRYFVLEDDQGRVKAVQPFFLLQQDFVQGAGPKTLKFVGAIRKLLPKFLTIRTLMVGCAAGEGHLADADDAAGECIGKALHEALRKYAKLLKAPMVVWKEFHFRYRKSLAPLAANGYTRIPSLPFTRLNIDYATFDEYMMKVLSKTGRKDLRRKFKVADEAGPLEMQVVQDIAPYVDQVHPLYMQVHNKSTLQFEKLTKDYFSRIGREMPDKARFFIWRLKGKIVAFNFCMVHGDELWDEVIGLDYAVAYDLHLYFLTIRDVLSWAIQNGYKWYCSGGQGFEPKLHLRCELMPVDLYVTHTWPLANFVMRKVLPLVEPTRGDKTLEKFPNYAEVWGDGKG